MTSRVISEVLNWLHTLPNRDLQELNSEYQVNIATALYLLGQRQSKDIVRCILNKLEKTSGTHFKFDDLIVKLQRRLPNDTNH